MPEVVFPDEQSFQDWNDAQCAERGIPFPGRNAATGELALAACWTTAWVEPHYDEKGRIVVSVPDDDAATDPVLVRLEVVEAKPRVDIVREKVAFAVHRELPETWTDEKGAVLDVAAAIEASRSAKPPSRFVEVPLRVTRDADVD